MASISSLASRSAALVTTAVLLAGCSASGGGWYGGETPKRAKVTMGFEFTCEPLSGELSFHDRRTGVNFAATPSSCGDWGMTWSGDYRPRPRGESGTFHARFVDTGATGPSKGDRVQITLVGGSLDGYSFDEQLTGGNITID
jgi:hypothetical protein